MKTLLIVVVFMLGIAGGFGWAALATPTDELPCLLHPGQRVEIEGGTVLCD